MAYDKTVWDQHTSCEALHVRRRGYFDVRGFLAASSLASLVDFLAADGGAGSFLGTDDENDVVSASWHKDVLSPSGVFSLQLKQRKRRYLELIQPGDLVAIFMDNAKRHDGPRFTGKFITMGIVESVRESVSTDESGAERMMVTVSGRDFGMVFQETSTVFDPAFAQIEQALFTQAFQQRLYQQRAVAQSPVENVLTILDLFYNAQASGSQLVAAQWQFQNKYTQAVSLLSLLDVTTFVQRPMFGYSIVDALSPSQAGNVWTLLETYANRVVNEFFVDVRDYTPGERAYMDYQNDVASAFVAPADALTQEATVAAVQATGAFRAAPERNDGTVQVLALVHRQMPYDVEAFTRLPQSDVYPTEVLELDVGYSGHDVVNYFKIRSPILPPEFQEATYGVKVNVNSVYRFGLKRMEPESMYFFASGLASGTYTTGSAGVSDFSDIYDYYIGLLSTWHAANEAMLSGSMTCRFRPDIRVGTRLRLHRRDDGRGRKVTADGHDYYVQSVSHHFSVEPGASRTSLTLVRGIDLKSSGLEANLRWTKNGSDLPQALNSYVRVTPFGVQMEASGGERVISDQQTPTLAGGTE